MDQYIVKPTESVEAPNVPLAHFILEMDPVSVAGGPRPQLIESSTGRTYSWNDVRQKARKFAAGLQEKWGVKSGDVINIFSFNTIEYPIIVLGAFIADLVVTPANPSYTVRELVHQLKDSGAKSMIVHPDLLKVAKASAKEAGISKIASIGYGSVDGISSFETLLSERYAQVPKPNPNTDYAKQIACLVYSSGTTGAAKGVMLSHMNLVSNICQYARHEFKDLDKSSVWSSSLPFYHIYGFTATLLNGIKFGITLVITPKQFDIGAFCDAVQRYKITFAQVVPPIALMISNSPIVEKYDISSLEMLNSGAAPCPKEIILAIKRKYNVGLKQAYGLTETSPIVVSQRFHEAFEKIGSVGRLVASVEALIVNDKGEPVGRNTEGEVFRPVVPGTHHQLWFRGKNIMMGYLNNPKATQDSLTPDGWFKSGDIGYCDSEGHFYITDRVKELIKFKGFQVPPAELESLLLDHPAVQDAGVIGYYSEGEATELPKAYIVLESGKSKDEGTAADIVKFISSKVAGHKRLRAGVTFIDEIPKSLSGKILRRLLRERAKHEGKGLACENHTKSRL